VRLVLRGEKRYHEKAIKREAIRIETKRRSEEEGGITIEGDGRKENEGLVKN